MNDMKDSGIPWIGEIPENWDIMKTLYVLDMPITDGPHETPVLYDDGIPFISAESIADGYINFNAKRGYISQQYYDECCKKYKPQKLDIYMVKSGATTGKVAIVETNEIFTIWSPLAVFRADIEKILPYYLFYFIQSEAYLKQVSTRWSYGTQQNIGMRVLESLKVCVPSLIEQQRIADFLDEKCGEIDGIVAKIQREIEMLKQYKQSVISEAVTKGIRHDVQMKNSGIDYIGNIPENWRIIKIKYIATNLSKGNGITKEDIVVDGDIPCVRYGEIYSQYNYSFKKCLTRTNLTRISSPQYFSYGDVLFAGTGELVEEIGKCIVYLGNEECLAGGDIVLLKHNQIPIYLGYALNSRYIQIQKSVGKAKLKVVHISARNIGNIRLLLPPLPEQREIAAYLDQKCAAIDSIISAKEKQLQTLDAYKKSLIYEYVTGKKRVPTA